MHIKKLNSFLIIVLIIILFGCVESNNPILDSNIDSNIDSNNSTIYSNLNSFIKAKTGDTVLVHYTGKLESGEIFDSSIDREPLTVVIGTTPLISGFKNALIGMKEGDKKTVTILPKDGYGEIFYLDINMFTGFDELTEGMVWSNSVSEIKIVSIDGNKIGVTNNHNLAGKTLIFEIEMVKIN